MAQQERKTYEPQEVAKCCLRIHMDRIPERLRRCVFFPDDRSTIGHRVRHGNGRTAAERGFVSSGHYRNNGHGRQQHAIGAQRNADRGFRAAEWLADVAGHQHDSRRHVYQCYCHAGESADWILECEPASATGDQHTERNHLAGSDSDAIKRDHSPVDSFGREHGKHHRFEV